jgi:cell pole-organizing protein PopZ
VLGVKPAYEGVDDVESEMTQPAKVQEPSMEEILASIRRIIADDETKPAAAEKPASPAPAPAAPAPAKPAAAAAPAVKPPVMKDIPPSAIPAAQAAAAKAPPPSPPAKPAPPAAAPAPAPVSNSQDDIDALLNGLDASTTPEEIRPPLPDGDVFELTDDMAVALPEPAAQPSFHKIEPEDDLEFTESAASRAVHRQPVYEPPPFESAAPPMPAQQILSRSTVSAVESAFNTLANTVLSNNARTLEDLVKEMLRPMLKSWLDDNLPGLVERIVKAEIERVSRGGR